VHEFFIIRGCDISQASVNVANDGKRLHSETVGREKGAFNYASAVMLQPFARIRFLSPTNMILTS